MSETKAFRVKYWYEKKGGATGEWMMSGMIPEYKCTQELLDLYTKDGHKAYYIDCDETWE